MLLRILIDVISAQQMKIDQNILELECQDNQYLITSQFSSNLRRIMHNQIL